MERLDLIIKSGVGLTVGLVTWLIGSFGIAFTVLLGLLLLDFISGFLVGAYEKKLSSSVGIKGLIKKTYVILLIGAVYLIEVAILKSGGVIASGVSGAYCVIEFVSIAENGGKLGVPLPDKIKSLILTLKNKETDKTV